MVTEVHQETVVGLSRQDRVGPGTGVDMEDFDDLGNVVFDGARFVPLVTTSGFHTI